MQIDAALNGCTTVSNEACWKPSVDRALVSVLVDGHVLTVLVLIEKTLRQVWTTLSTNLNLLISLTRADYQYFSNRTAPGPLWSSACRNPAASSIGNKPGVSGSGAPGGT
ncbi:hypothetical protein SV7mr_41970 [Stieleria bergensis]|uniref:Uncharacterized protein n=1 Tax=Stieleria bergensis TaxID=2528025 RepID=A0A517SZU0_9BACT|nr:hypothetical protein SV7mr_41970 [Planctomycetes bacterium SV_7m_r]